MNLMCDNFPKRRLTHLAVNTPCRIGVFSAGIFLISCTVFDPAPYNPQLNPDFVKDHPDFNRFKNLTDAAAKLNVLAIGYAGEGNELMREQLVLDVPIFGLAAGTVASGIYHGSKDLTLGLGLGSAGFAGAKLYFNPQGRAAAYNGAALALACGASVADQLDTIVTTEDPSGTAIKLDQALAGARKSTDPNVATLVSAGQKALGDLISAIGIVSGAPARLEGFAAAIMRGATTKAITGVQNIDAALTAIRAAGPNPSAAGAATKPGGVASPALAGTATISIPENLQTLTALSASITKDINDAWNNMTSCTLQATAG